MPEIQKMISEISFRLIKPDAAFRAPYTLKTPPDNPMVKMLVRLEAWVEFFNTKVSSDDATRIKKLKKICYMPKMSTFAIGYIIDRIVAQLPPGEAFVNVGLWHGFTFLAGLVNNHETKCIGIDNFSEFGGPKEAFLQKFNQYKHESHHFFEMDYKKYFAEQHKDPIGFYIYDGEHSYENQFEGLRVAEPYLAPNCIVLIDDTNFSEVYQATNDFINKSSCQYRVLFDQKTHGNAHPTYWNGIMIFQKTS